MADARTEANWRFARLRVHACCSVPERVGVWWWRQHGSRRPGCGSPLPPRICTNPLCVNLAGPSERLLSELYCGGGAGGEGASYVLQRELPGGALGGGAHQECGGRDR
ncbi:hypothetical protein PLESTF_000804800 [Pleodorina starrii]|nr:hypothetical protein PLESTF_000804800 [Pleodorina starrii]